VLRTSYLFLSQIDANRPQKESQREGRRGETGRHEKRRDTHAKHIALGHYGWQTEHTTKPNKEKETMESTRENAPIHVSTRAPL
jgi:CxxC motif-containing protein (DUF1111 family)